MSLDIILLIVIGTLLAVLYLTNRIDSSKVPPDEEITQPLEGTSQVELIDEAIELTEVDIEAFPVEEGDVFNRVFNPDEPDVEEAPVE
jgi:hypothetical protein